MINFGNVPNSIKNNKRIIYKGYVYETALKITNDHSELVDMVIYSIINYDWKTEYKKSIVVTNNDNEDTLVDITCIWGDEITGSSIMLGRNYAQLDLEVGGFKFYREPEYLKLREVLYHEILHIIDPKQYKSELKDEPFNEYLPKGHPRYSKQILEREQILSSKAKNAIDYMRIHKLNIKDEISNNFEMYLKTLPSKLRTPNERKVFAKLLYFYMEN